MTNTFRVVLDACVMLPQNLNNLLLTLAHDDLFTPVWSADLLDEVERNLVQKFKTTESQAAHRVTKMRCAFPHAEDYCAGYLEVIDSMTNHPKDRHVLAAAVISRAALIVTANLKDFPSESLSTYGIEAVHPDEFLLDQLDLDPNRVLAAMTMVAQRNQFPPQTLWELRVALQSLTPRFAAAVEELTEPVAAFEIVDAAELEERHFAETGAEVLFRSLSAARLWWDALRSRDKFPRAIERLSIVPDQWDFAATAQALEGYALATGVHSHIDRTDVVYLKFVPDAGHSMRAFGEISFHNFRVLAMQQGSDSIWRAYGLLINEWPAKADRRPRQSADGRL
ncbi:PIN domain-containing protein (plasmid) [Rhodococcus globerulus]|uniref:PIN domain-containing protein n=1 Tax=Rhodococcus globerulus TaxID=33008 RepID=UPI0039E867B6